MRTPATDLVQSANRIGQIAMAAGKVDIDEACRLFTGDAEAICVLDLAPSPTVLEEIFANAPRCDAHAMENDRQPLLRARRLAVFIDADERLEARQLAALIDLLSLRPTSSSLTMLTTRSSLSDDARSAIQRRAWRTLVVEPPSNTEGLSLASRGVLIIAPDASSGALSAADAGSINGWMASDPSVGNVLDARALRAIAAQLESALQEAAPTAAATVDLDPWHRLAAQLELKGVDRIERAFDEIDSACTTEIRVFGDELASMVHRGEQAQPTEGELRRELGDAADKLARRCDALSTPILRDLNAAILDDNENAAHGADEQSSRDTRGWPPRAACSQFFLQMAQWSVRPVQLQDRERIDATSRRVSDALRDSEPWFRPSTTVAACVTAGSGYLALQALSTMFAWPVAAVLLPAVLGGLGGGLYESASRRRRTKTRLMALAGVDLERLTNDSLKQARTTLAEACRLHVQDWRRSARKAGDELRAALISRQDDATLAANRAELARLISELDLSSIMPSGDCAAIKEKLDES